MIDSLAEALRKVNIEYPKRDTETGRIIRWGKNNRYWLKKFEGGYVFGDFATDISGHVFDKNCRGRKLAGIQDRALLAKKEADIERAETHEKAAAKANKIWETASPLVSHEYFTKKRVSFSNGLRECGGRLVIPLSDENGKIWSAQFIDAEGNKRFLSGGRKKGCYFLIGDVQSSSTILLCEGFATGASLYECLEIPVVVAFDSGNLKPVAVAIKAKYKDKKIIICADNDQFHENGVNPGLEKAAEAAREINASVVKPEFRDVSTKPTDFNDLFVLEGADAVRAALRNAETPKIPAGFFLTDDGLFYVCERAKEKIRVSNYISTLAFVRERDGGTSRLVEFRDYKKRLVRTFLQPQMFANNGDQAKVHLSSKGFVYSGNPRAKNKLTEYLLDSAPEKEVRLIKKIGFIDEAYVRPDIIIGELSDETILDASINDAAFSNSGTLEEWINNVAKYCRDNSRLAFAVCTAFGSMALKPCGIPSGGFHFSGRSAAGKTTCLKVAASVFGTPRYVKTWKTTDNALENTAFKRNDALLILDELSEMSAKAGDVAYMLSDGEGKDRLDKNCNSRELYEWRLLFLSSGEVDLASHMAESNRQSKAGQEARFINISAKADENSLGIFENLHGFSDGAEFAKRLQANAAKYYGTASIEFAKKILDDSNIKDSYEEYCRIEKTENLPENASEQDRRVFERFTFVGFAGELAIKYGVVDWPSGESGKAALKCFNSWLQAKGGVGNLEDRRILDRVKAFFESNVCGRFYDLDGPKDQKINNLAGYKRELENGVVYYATTSIFQNEICKGFVRDQVIEVLKKNNIISSDGGRDCGQQKWTPHGNKRVYVFDGKTL